MRLSTSKIGAKELTAIIIFVVGIKTTGGLPATLINHTANAFWLVPSLSFLVILLPLCVQVYLLRKHHDKNLVDLSRFLLGQKLTVVLGSLLFLTSLILTGIGLREVAETLSAYHYRLSPIWTIIVLLMTAGFLGSVIGYSKAASLNWILFIFIIPFLILSSFAFYQASHFWRIFPILGNGIKPLLHTGVFNTGIYIELFLLGLFFTSSQNVKSFRKGMLIGCIFIILELTQYFYFYATLMEYNYLDDFKFLFQEISTASTLTLFVTDLNAIMVPVWLMVNFTRFAMLFIFNSELVAQTFNIYAKRSLILPTAFLAFMIALYGSSYLSYGPIYRITMNTASLIILIYPFLLLAADRLKKNIRKQTG